jgi:hypothetical protein
VYHATILHALVPAQDLLEQPPQLRDVPLPVGELVQRAADGVLASDLELFEESRIGKLDPETIVEHQQPLTNCGNDRRDGISLGVHGCRPGAFPFDVHARQGRPRAGSASASLVLEHGVFSSFGSSRRGCLDLTERTLLGRFRR